MGNNGQNTTYTGVLSGAGGLTKIGSGILSMGGLSTYSGPTVIADGTLQLSPLATLAHRWSFGNGLNDSVGGVTAIISGSCTQSSSGVTVNGNGISHVSYVSLGNGSTNILPTTNAACTIELWATENQVQSWSRIFDFGSTPGAQRPSLVVDPGNEQSERDRTERGEFQRGDL